MENKKILICGAGSVGIYLGTMLYSKHHQVSLFGRRKLKPVEKFVIINGKKLATPEKIFSIPKNETYDVIFITTKLYDFENMIKLIKKSKIKAKTISTIQNGLVDLTKYEKILKQKIIPIVAFSGFNIENNKISINQTSQGWKTHFNEKGKEISKLLLHSGINCHADKNFDSLRAEKTIVNCCLNALSAIEDKPFCELFKNQTTRKNIDELFEECYNILKKEYKLDSSSILKKRMIQNWSKLNHYSSTCQDLHSNRPLETKFFNGYLIQLGKKHKLPTKNNQNIINKIKNIRR